MKAAKQVHICLHQLGLGPQQRDEQAAATLMQGSGPSMFRHGCAGKFQAGIQTAAMILKIWHAWQQIPSSLH